MKKCMENIVKLCIFVSLFPYSYFRGMERTFALALQTGAAALFGSCRTKCLTLQGVQATRSGQGGTDVGVC